MVSFTSAALGLLAFADVASGLTHFQSPSATDGAADDAADDAEKKPHERKPKFIPNTVVPMPEDYEDFSRGHRPVWNLFHHHEVPGIRVPFPPVGAGIPGFNTMVQGGADEVFMDAKPEDIVGHMCAPGGDAAGHYFYNIWEPQLVAYLVAENRSDRSSAAVVVAPGGGSVHLAWEPEGIQAAEWLNSRGISAFVLKYRVPTGGPDDIQLMDAQRALSLVRSRAKRFNLDPDRIGFMGSSHGGQMGIQVATTDTRLYERLDEADDVSFRPAFMILMYPGIPEISDTKLLKNMPPTLLAFAANDPCCPAKKTRAFADALAKFSKAPHLAHEYVDGGHGWGSCDYYPILRGKEVCNFKVEFGNPFLDAHVLRNSTPVASA